MFEGGVVSDTDTDTETETGTLQSSPVSPFLANIARRVLDRIWKAAAAGRSPVNTGRKLTPFPTVRHLLGRSTMGPDEGRSPDRSAPRRVICCPWRVLTVTPSRRW